MRIPQGMEPMVFSYAHYKVNDFDKVIDFFNKLYDNGLFGIDESNINKKEMSGSFIQDYPKGHWNPMASHPGAKQVLGSAKIENGILKVEAYTRGRLKKARELLEQGLGSSIEFQKEESMDIMEMMKKRQRR